MWLQEKLKLYMWFTFVACIIELLDSAVPHCHMSKTNSKFPKVPLVSKYSFIRLKMAKLIYESFTL